MLADRRDKLRKQIRSEALNRRFALQRKAVIKGDLAIFYQLCSEMDELPENGIFDFNARLAACVERYPEEENTYILIGNWLARHPELFEYFENHLTHAARLLDGYVWSLTHLENIYLENSTQINDLERRLRGIATMLADIAREVMGRGWNLGKVVCIQDNYILSLRRLLQRNFDLGELVEPVTLALALLENIARLTPTTECIQKQFNNEQLYNYLQFLLSLREREEWDLLCNHGLQLACSRAFAVIAVPILRNLPQSREDCLRVLDYLLRHEKDTQIMGKPFFKELLNQLLFLMEEVPHLLPTILTQLKLMLDQCKMSELTDMLQLGVHVRLAKGIQLAMERYDNLLLETCLAGTFNLLTRLSLNEQKLMARVKEDIERVNFHHMIEGLIQNEQNQIVDHLVNNIVDEFYSEEVAEAI